MPVSRKFTILIHAVLLGLLFTSCSDRTQQLRDQCSYLSVCIERGTNREEVRQLANKIVAESLKHRLTSGDRTAITKIDQLASCVDHFWEAYLVRAHYLKATAPEKSWIEMAGLTKDTNVWSAFDFEGMGAQLESEDELRAQRHRGIIATFNPNNALEAQAINTPYIQKLERQQVRDQWILDNLDAIYNAAIERKDAIDPKYALYKTLDNLNTSLKAFAVRPGNG